MCCFRGYCASETSARKWHAQTDEHLHAKKIAEEIDAPLVTAMQMNRSGESFNRNSSSLVDDSSAISLSDRLQWFATFVAIFRRKTTDEIALDGDRFGTHKLIPLKTRFQGRDAAGHQDLIRRRVVESVNGRESDSERLVNNFINFSGVS